MRDLINTSKSLVQSNIAIGAEKRKLSRFEDKGLPTIDDGEQKIAIRFSDQQSVEALIEVESVTGDSLSKRILKITFLNGNDKLVLHLPNSWLKLELLKEADTVIYADSNTILTNSINSLSALLKIFHEMGHALLQQESEGMPQFKLNFIRLLLDGAIAYNAQRDGNLEDFLKEVISDEAFDELRLNYLLTEFTQADFDCVLEGEAEAWQFALRMIEDVLDFYAVEKTQKDQLLNDMSRLAELLIATYVKAGNRCLGMTPMTAIGA
jgi:hypothetical protein